MSDYGPLYAGLDPGASGGLGLLDADGQFCAAYPWPETERDIADLLVEYAPHISRAYLEAVHAFPGQGVTSMFTFGKTYGFLRGLLIAMAIPFEDVQPSVWTKALGLASRQKVSYSKRKKLHRAFAQQWFPRLEITDKTADAILIAEFGRRQNVRPALLSDVEDVVVK